MARLVAITACPTGIAHTVMAAEALRRVAALKGHDIWVETLGSEGARTPLDAATVAAADAVILAADITVDETRFQGKPLVRTTTALAIRETGRIIDEAVARVDIPKKGSEYDTEGLRAKAIEWKRAYDLGNTMILSAGREIEYRTVVQAMDTIRKDGERDLFPDVLFGAVATPGGG